MKGIPIVVAMLCWTAAVRAAEPPKPAAPAPAAPAGDSAEAAPAPAARARGAQDRVEPDATPRGPASRPADRVDLDTTVVTGNRELPRVLYVVPWKRADLGETGGRPARSLLDEVLTPVDRDVFRRQNRYYRALQPDGVSPGNEAAAEGEK